MSDLTVVVPIHDPLEVHTHRIIRLVRSIAQQENLPRKVIFSANHGIAQEEMIASILQNRCEVQFLRNQTSGAAENTNFLMDHVTTRFTKILFQDDFLRLTDALCRIEYLLSESWQKWLVSGCDQFNEETKIANKTFTPKYRGTLRKGVNSIGAPSVVAFVSDIKPRFNESMVYMFDCEWYLQMKHQYGLPLVLDDALVSIGIHSQQATHWANVELSREIEMTKKLHDWNMITRKCKCYDKGL